MDGYESNTTLSLWINYSVLNIRGVKSYGLVMYIGRGVVQLSVLGAWGEIACDTFQKGRNCDEDGDDDDDEVNNNSLNAKTSS